jgi:uncharacterized protein (TIGR03437 family)
MYLTAGKMTPQLPDGTIPSSPLSVPVRALSMDDFPCPVVYAGDAPGQVEGVVQFNCTVQQQTTSIGIPVRIVSDGSETLGGSYVLFTK